MLGDVIGSLKVIYGYDGCSFNFVCFKDSWLVVVDFEIVWEVSYVDVVMILEIVDFLIGFVMKKEICEYEFLCFFVEERYCLLIEWLFEFLEIVM